MPTPETPSQAQQVAKKALDELTTTWGASPYRPEEIKKQMTMLQEAIKDNPGQPTTAQK